MVNLTVSRILGRRVGWLLIAVSLVCGIIAAIMLVSAVGPSLKDALVRHPCATPCSEVLDLDAGNYLVFEEIGHSSSVGPLSTTTQAPTTIAPADVAVTSSTGRALEMAEAGSSETINRDGAIYRDVVSFHVPEAGAYRVVVDAPQVTQVLVAPGIGQTFLKALPGLGVLGMALTLGLTGLVLVTLAWIRRRTAEQSTRGIGPAEPHNRHIAKT